VLNNGLRVQDWYLIPESYSEPLIIDAIERFGIPFGETVLDPFAGAGTTLVSAVLRGINAVGLEVNPFLSFASEVKLNWNVDLTTFETSMSCILNEARSLLDAVTTEQNLFTQSVSETTLRKARTILSEQAQPEMPRLHKWISPAVVSKVLLLRYLIDSIVPIGIRRHFLLALAAILRPASNMKLMPHAFGSNTFKEDAPVYDMFALKIRKMYDDLRYVQSLSHRVGRSLVVNCDARRAEVVQSDLLPASLAITSPPYLNNLDYTMQTRLELFFLGFVKNMNDLRTLRKGMVTCDAKAMYKDVHDSEEIEGVQSIMSIAEKMREAHKGKDWGWDYAYMTTQYFGGMLRVLRSVRPLIKPHGHFVLIVGESAHSGVKVPVPDFLAELGQRAGYTIHEINVLRRRRSSSHHFELCESEVILQKR